MTTKHGALAEEQLLSPEQSAAARKEQAAPTGEAAIARAFSKAFAASSVSAARNRYEFESARGTATIPNPRTGKDQTMPVLFWYNDKSPRITTFLNGAVKVVSLLGRKDKDGLYTKFSVLTSKLAADTDGDLLTYLKGPVSEAVSAPLTRAARLLETAGV